MLGVLGSVDVSKTTWPVAASRPTAQHLFPNQAGIGLAYVDQRPNQSALRSGRAVRLKSLLESLA